MKLENVCICGITDSVRASKYPKSVNISRLNGEITETVDKLARADIGSGHDNFLNGIICQFDLTFSLKAWAEMERYHFIDFVSSQSTMHMITRFDIDRQCNEYVSPLIKGIVKNYVERYNENPTPENYLSVLYNVPAGFQLTARMTTNYRQLKTIYAQRKNHRLPEWREFCAALLDLPLSGWITGENMNGN